MHACIVLCCIALHGIVLHCIVLYCIVLYRYYIVLYCIVLYCIVLYCIVLYCIALHCIGLVWFGSLAWFDGLFVCLPVCLLGCLFVCWFVCLLIRPLVAVRIRMLLDLTRLFEPRSAKDEPLEAQRSAGLSGDSDPTTESFLISLSLHVSSLAKPEPSSHQSVSSGREGEGGVQD